MIYDYLPLIVYRSDEAGAGTDKAKGDGIQNSQQPRSDWNTEAQSAASANHDAPPEDTNAERPAFQNLEESTVGALMQVEKAQLEDANNI
jgi:hypothetical protein